MLDRLVIGTANFGRDYNGHYVDGKEQNLIMEYMKEVGIEWLDVATAYGTDKIGRDNFFRIVKTNSDYNPYHPKDKYISHSEEKYNRKWHDGFSTDIPEACFNSPLFSSSFCGSLFVEFPYSIMNRHFKFTKKCKFIARSIFCKGKALKYFSPRECIDFVLMNPRIDKVILGVDSVDQLRENIAHLVKMEKFEHNEEVDTRKF